MNTPCEWFVLCQRPATHLSSHPVLPPVPVCARCAEQYCQPHDLVPIENAVEMGWAK